MHLHARLIIYTTMLYAHAAAQKDKYEPVKEDWAIAKSTYSINRNMKDQSLPSYDRSIIYLENSQAILLTNIKDDYSLVCINDQGATLWQVPLPGKGLGISKRKENYLTIYEDESKNLHTLLMDGKTHQVIADKNIYSPDKLDRDYFIENNPSGEFDHLLIRTEPSGRADYLGSAKLELIYIDDALAPKLFDITHDLGGGYFVGTVTGDDGIHFITYLNPQGLIVKKYDTQAKVIASLTAHVYVTKFKSPVCTLDADNHNAVCLCVKYKTDDKTDADVCAYADFTAKKMATSVEQVLDKDYQKDMKGQVIKNPDISSVSLKSLEDLAPVRIISAGGKILVIKEIRYDIRDGDKTRYYNLHIIISTYTKSMKLVSEMILDRASELFMPYCRTIGVHIKNNILYLITTSTVGIGRNGTVFDAIDLTTNTVITTGVAFKQKFLENGAAEGAATLWFDNSCLVDVQHVANKIIKVNLSSSLQKMDY